MQEKKSKKRFYVILGAEILVVVLIAMFFFVDFGVLFEDDSRAFVDSSTPCDLRKNMCEVKLSDKQTVSLEVLPKGIPLMKPLTLIAHAKGIKANSIGVKIYAINMEMGTHKITLRRTEGDTFVGKQTLPTCIVGGMIWNADLTSSSFSDNKGVRFTFKTK